MPIPPFRDDGWLPVGHHLGDWEEIIQRFGDGDRRARLTISLLRLRDDLRICGVNGVLVIDGSYVSAKQEPKDFDVLLIAPSDIQIRKDSNPSLSDLLDAQKAEEERGYSLFYIPEDSPVLEILRGLWDISKDGIPKGVIEVSI